MIAVCIKPIEFTKILVLYRLDNPNVVISKGFNFRYATCTYLYQYIIILYKQE